MSVTRADAAGARRLGVDLDNTIVCYDASFHRLALERGLIEPDLAVTKVAVRDRLRALGREDEWTALQGAAYGPRMAEAQAFEGAAEALRDLLAAGWEVHIVSHRTRAPYSGPPYDLHEAALGWLARLGVFEGPLAGIGRSRVHLETSRAAKAERVRRLGLTHFIDDLPEFFEEPALPGALVRIHFQPVGPAAAGSDRRRVRTWTEVVALLLGGEH